MKFVAVIPEALFQSNSYWSAILIILGILVVARLINKHFKDKKFDNKTIAKATKFEFKNIF